RRRHPYPCARAARARTGAARMTRIAVVPLLAGLLVLSGCARQVPEALGTLEYDRITLPAPASERIVDIAVREGERVAAGARVLTLERTRGDAQLAAAQAEVARQREALA